MRRVVMGAMIFVMVSGCGGARKSSLLLERPARGPLDEAQTFAHRVAWTVAPVMQTKTQNGVEVVVNYASQTYLNNFFQNEKVFGLLAGRNPYYPEHFVFYVKIANESPKKIRIDPMEFTLVDDRGNQLAAIGVDYVTAFADYRQPMSTATRGVLEEARPGYFGLSFPVGRLVAQKPQWRFALLKQSALQAGYLHPGVIHDGLVTFWNPSTEAKKLRLLVNGIKTSFDANDWPKESIDFVFEFDVVP
jgi:hypothetical protein